MIVSLQARIEQASKVILEYQLLEQVLFNLGVDDSDVGISVLGFVSFDDFNNALVSLLGKKEVPPLPRLKMAWSIIKGEDKKIVAEETPSGFSELIKTVKPLAQWTNLELLEKYGKDGLLQTHEELAKRGKNRFVIIFNEDESVDIDNSLHMLKKAQFQDTPQIYKLKSGDLREVYRVGDFPMQIFYECPIHKDVLLLDGYCEECCDHWDNSDTEKNTLLRLIAENKHSIDIHQYLDKSYDELAKRFPQVFLLHKTLKETDNLPRLKRKISKPKNGDPFRVVGTHKVF